MARSARRLGGGGGIGIKIELPKDFTWDNDSIPVAITLTGHKSEPREVEELRFRFQDDDPDSAPKQPGETSSYQAGERVDHEWIAPERVSLPAGQTHAVTIDMPLPYSSGAPDGPIPETDENSSFGKKLLSNVMKSAMGPPHDIRQYRVTVTARVEGARMGASAQRKIRFGSALQRGRGSFSLGNN